MIWLAIILTPVLGAGLALAPACGRVQRWLAPAAALPALLAPLWAGRIEEAEWSSFLLGVRFGFGEMGVVFLFFTGCLWFLAGLYGAGYFRGRPAGPFQFFFLLAMGGNFGLVVAQDVPSFYTCFALMTFSAYGVVVHYRTEEAWRAGRIYIVMAVIGEGLLLGALFLSVDAAGSLRLAEMGRGVAGAPNRDWIMGLAFFGFGVKAGALGVHFWLPLAHPVAPVPASAVLSGAMIKAGLLGWMHFLPLGEGAFPGWSGLLIVLGMGAAFYGVGAGLGQRDPKTLLAYSSISQMGVLTTGVGIGLAREEAWPVMLPVLLLYAMNHALAKGALFLGTGLVLGTEPRGRLRRWILAGSALAALALAGGPGSGGGTAKYALKHAAVFAPERWHGGLNWLLPLSAVATALLLGRFLWLAVNERREPRAPEANAWMLGSWTALLAGLLGVGLVALRPVQPELGVAPISLAAVWGALWPIAAGLALLLGGKRILAGGFTVPAGDVVLWVERGLRGGRRFWSRHSLPKPHRWQLNLMQAAELVSAWEKRGQWSARMELWLVRWETAGCVLIGLALLLLALLYWGGRG